MIIAGQLQHAREVVEERAINLESHRCALLSLHPHLPKENSQLLDTALLAQVGVILTLSGPWTVDSVAQQLADQYGAFPWDGPVGNGLTLDYYRSRFREMARENLFLGRQMGLIPAEE